jgi:hypothetical protein
MNEVKSEFEAWDEDFQAILRLKKPRAPQNE